MTAYLQKSFTVGMPAGESYRNNWEATFGKKEEKPEPVEEPRLQEDGLELVFACDASHLRTEEEEPQNGQPQ